MDMLDQQNVILKVKDNELKNIYGGASLSGAIINYFTKALNTVLDVGRNLGSAIRRIKYKNMCKF